MILVRFFGGAKKLFGAEYITVSKDEMRLDALLEMVKTETRAEPDLANMLVAVNGADSSSLDGKSTMVTSGDTVSIIPIIHGGSHTTMVRPVRGSAKLGAPFLDSLRTKHDKLVIQAVSSRFVLSESHASRVATISLEAKRAGTLLADRVETDMLMRFAHTPQIDRAIRHAGMAPNQDFVLVWSGPQHQTALLQEMLGMPPCVFAPPDRILRTLGMQGMHPPSMRSDNPLEDMLVEMAAVLAL